MTAAILDFAHAFSARSIGCAKHELVRHVTVDEVIGRIPVYRMGEEVTVAGWPGIGVITGHKLGRFFVQFPGCTVNAFAAQLTPVRSVPANEGRAS
jgi:hypothetical protein